MKSKSTHSWKPKLSMTEHGHQMDVQQLHAKLHTCPEISPESHSVQVLQMRYHICMWKILLSMSESSGSWRHQNPQHALKMYGLHNVEVGHNMVEEEKATAERLVPAMPADTFQRQIRSSSPTDLVSGNPVENYIKNNNRDATQCRTPTQNNTD